ncbi:MAG: peptidoglycan editing factor PgeF [Candidatus Krumholzibacteria bacterium]|nr:peptidoglycan editing factor PgeF [Candidatus Krumholzibacteria bacterium]
MQDNKIGDLEFLSYTRFEAYRKVTNVVTTRMAGRSAGVYHSLNLGLGVGDDPDAVLENRAMLAEALGIEPLSLTFAEQVHGSKVAVVKSPSRGRGAVTNDDALSKTDALVTNVRDLPLMVLIADCVAISFYDPHQNAVGLAHAGWKGTLGRIAELTVAKMVSAFGCDPADIVAGISPSIGRGHYDVGEEVVDAFRKEFGRQVTNDLAQEDMDGTCYLDLWAANESQLLGQGIPAENIALAEMCTACHPGRFYSHRHDSGRTGRFGALVMLHATTSRQY